jgi:eukaryotic-like serine/threonine-protein kinase
MSDRQPAFWDDVERVFSLVVDANTADRGRLLDVECEGRARVRAEVESLLAVHVRAERFMGDPTFARDAPVRLTLREGDVVGQFRLVERIGSGGMATVYRAERADGAFDQRVAVKIIAEPIEHEDVSRRFLAERQILASLHHPHIVGLLDAGLTPQGFAYLVMELVDGVPITTYCRDRMLPVEGRLKLLRQVCDAVQYAHGHFVVHRDLKPANVLVTADGVPKVLDFGIATLLGGPHAEAARRPPETTGSDPFTPAYASPEQLHGGPVTIASDIYALGMLAFELLTGTRPYDVNGKPLDEVIRLVTQTPTARPSETNPPDDAKPPYDWRRLLRGDLDAIALRACHRQPERRYASADALSQDIGRYLSGAPVEARKATFWYVTGKLAARHRIAFTSAGLSAALVVIALAVALWQGHVARVERQRAVRRFEDVRALANAVIFKIHDAVAPLPGSTPVRQTIVTEGLKYLEGLATDVNGDPDLQFELGRAYIKIGAVQGRPNVANLGDRDGAIASFRKAAALLQPLMDAPAADADVFSNYIDARRFLSETFGAMGRREEGIAEATETVRAAEQFASRHPTLDRAQSAVAAAEFTLATRIGWPNSLPHWQKSGALYDALLAAAPDNSSWQRNAALVEKYVGGYYETSRDYATALAHHQRALALDQKRVDRRPDDRQGQLDLAIDLSNVAYGHWMRKELQEAIALYKRSLDMRQRLLATDPSDVFAQEKVAFVYRQLGALYSQAGDAREALLHYRAGVDQFQKIRPDRTVNLVYMADCWSGIARLEAEARRSRESCEAYGRAFDLYQQTRNGERADDEHPERKPLAEVARAAARCGHAPAVQHVRGESE